MDAKFYKNEVKLGGCGASVSSDPYGGLGGLLPRKNYTYILLS